MTMMKLSAKKGSLDMTTPLQCCTNCGAENIMAETACPRCGQDFPVAKAEQELLPVQFSSKEKLSPPQKLSRVTRRGVMLGLGGAAVLATIGVPFMIKVGQHLAATQNQEITLVPFSQDGDGFSSGMAWSPDGKKLVVYGDMMYIWNIADPLTHSKNILKVNVALPGIVAAAAWSPDGKYIAVASDLTSIVDATTGALLRSLGPRSSGNGGIVQIAWSPDGQYLATAYADGTTNEGNTRVQRWITKSWTQAKQLPGAYDEITSMAWSPNSKKLLIAGDISTNSDLRSNVQIWDGETTAPLLLQKADYSGGTYGAVWSPDGRFFAVGAGDGNVLRVYTAEGTFSTSYASSDILVTMAWSPTNHLLAVFKPGSGGGLSMVAYDWDASSGQLRSTSFTHEEMGGWDQYQFIWSPDGALVAYTEFSELVIWKPGWSFPQFDD